MKLWIGSRPGALQVSAPIGQSNCGMASRGVSATPSPLAEQPPAKVCSSIIQCPTSWVRVSPSPYFHGWPSYVPPGIEPVSRTTPSMKSRPLL